MPFKHINGRKGKLLNPFIRRIYLPKEINRQEQEIIHLTQPYGYEVFLNAKSKKVLTWYDDFMITKTKGIMQRYNKYRATKSVENANAITFISENSRLGFEALFEFESKYGDKLLSVNPIPIDDLWIKHIIDQNIQREDFIYIGGINKVLSTLFPIYSKFIEALGSKEKPLLHIYTSDDIPNIPENIRLYTIFHLHKSDEEIIVQLKKSIALLHLTLHEGYGLPIMESLAVGTPVITLKEASIPEETKKWTMQVNKDEIIDEMLKLYERPTNATTEAIQQAKKLNKEEYARQMTKLYESV